MRRRFALILPLLCLMSVSASAGVSHRVVLLTGTPVLGTEPQIIVSDFVGGPSFNNTGEIVIRSRFSGPSVTAGNDTGLLFVDSTSIASLVVREGDSTFLGPFSGVFTSFELNFVPVLRDSGKFGFHASVTRQNEALGTIWLGDASGLNQLIAYEVLQADGFEFDATWIPSYVDFFQLAMNQANTTSYLGALFPAPKEFNAVGTGHWFQRDGGPRELMLASGMVPPPGLTIGQRFLGFSKPALQNNGTIAFYASLADNAFTVFLDEGVYIYSQGVFQQAFHRGTMPTNAGPDEGIRKFIGWPVFGSQGSLAMLTQLFNTTTGIITDTAVIVDRGAGLEVVARGQQQAPGLPAGVTFVGFDIPMGDVDSSAPFRAGLAGPGITTLNKDALYRVFANNVLQLVVWSGQSLPGIASDETVLTVPLLPAGNNKGQIAFRADLTGPSVGISNSRGYWVSDTRGVLHQIVRTGEAFTVAPGDIRTVSNIEALLGSGGNSGNAIALNELGEFAYKLTFTDSSQAIVISTVVASTSLDLTGDVLIDGQDLGVMLSEWGFCEIRCESDFNNDGAVDGADMGMLLGAWNACDLSCQADFTGDGIVDGSDLGVLLSQWGCTVACTADLNGDGTVDGVDLGLLLSVVS